MVSREMNIFFKVSAKVRQNPVSSSRYFAVTAGTSRAASSLAFQDFIRTERIKRPAVKKTAGKRHIKSSFFAMASSGDPSPQIWPCASRKCVRGKSIPKTRAPAVIESSGNENPVKGKVGAMRQIEQESAITQVGDTATARTASAAIESMRSHAAVNQRITGPAVPQPPQPAKPATQMQDIKSQKASHGASFPATAAVTDPPAVFRSPLTRPVRHSRTSVLTNAKRAANAITPGMSVGSR